MTRKKYLSKKTVEKIRNDVLSNKTKYQIAKELDIPRSTVYYWTRDLPSKQCGWPGIRGKTLDLLKEIVSKGYVVPPCSYVQQRYTVLRKYFPTICRVTIYGRPIFFLAGKEDVAARVFLEKVNKKIISYQELKQITKVFGTNLSRTEKEAFFLRKRGKSGVKNKGVQKEGFLLLDDDSFSFFYIRRYCAFFHEEKIG
ncbi:MAG: hypothetical protein V1726_03580 [Methanobacteriota archaeon]